MSIVLGIDLGTQNLKIVCYDFEARETVAVENAPLNLYQTDEGIAEQQAQWWTHALKQSLKKLDKDVRQSIMAIGVSGQQHGFVPIDSGGNVLVPVKLWCDTSTRVECDVIMDSYGGADACLNEVGNLILPGYTASKIRWFRDTHPELYDKMDCILLPHDYLNFYLTGEKCMEAGDASGTGFMDIFSRTWSEKMLRAIDPDRDLRQCLPDIAISDENIGTLQANIAEKLGLPPDIPVAIGGGDNMMGAIGTGNVSPGVITMSLGTSGTVYAFSENSVVDNKGNIAGFCSSTGGWLPLLCTMNCTVSTELMRELFDLDVTMFDDKVGLAPPGANGVITVPFFNGERTPNLPNAKASVMGLDSNNVHQDNITRSAVEGATFAMRFGIDELAGLGIDASEIVLTGGGANSAIWRQIISDICDAPVTMLKQNEGAAFGAALQAVAMLNGPDIDWKALVDDHIVRDDERSCEPQPKTVNIYNDIYANYLQAVKNVAAFYN